MSEILTQAIVASQEGTSPAPTTPVTPSTPAADPSISSKFGALAKKEKAILKLKQDLSLREKDVQDKYSKYQEFETKKTQAKSNPSLALKMLEEMGLSYEDLTNAVLNDGKPTPEMQVKSVKDELEEFKKQLQKDKEEEERTQKERQEQEYSKAIEEFKTKINSFVENKDEYELINAYGQQELIYSTVEQHFDETKNVLSIKEASDLVEKYLEGEVDKALKLKKMQSKLAPKQPEEPKSKEPSFMKSGLEPKSLSNEITSSVPSMLPAKTENDRLKRALSKLG